MSRRRYLGWEPREVTTYEYGSDGRLVRSITTREAEWDDQERGFAEALAYLDADTCKGCGQPLSESTDAEAEGDWVTPPPDRCHSCTALSIHQERYDKSPHVHALLWQVNRKGA